ncbi:MAG: hypothetical protein FJ280_00860 [Planctomycetes bacterium]|nr:hypothetical protein [Planctomycetota bacterium]
MPDERVHDSHFGLRNRLNRVSGTTGGAGEGGLFSVKETYFARDRVRERCNPAHLNEVAIYIRVADGYKTKFMDLVHELSYVGFGADVSVGKGQFKVVSEDLEPAEEFDSIPNANACIVLSTFQPGPDDPTDGVWEAFVKYGKMGPDFGLENIFKRPAVMFRSGACFRRVVSAIGVGRCIPMPELLAPDACAQLRAKAVSIIHLALGLAVPFCWTGI